MEEKIKLYRKWQEENPDWELICDMEGTDHLYVQWHELPKPERMSWIGSYREDPKAAFEEFSLKRCKVESKCLTENLILCDSRDWPEGFNMLVFRTSIDGVRVI